MTNAAPASRSRAVWLSVGLVIAAVLITLLVVWMLRPAEPEAAPVPTVTVTVPATEPAEAGIDLDPPCFGSSLDLSTGEGETGASATIYPVTITNRGDACVLAGYPAVSFWVDESRHIRAAPIEGAMPSVARLPGGGTAQVNVIVPVFDDIEQCYPVDTVAVTMIIPGTTDAEALDLVVSVCNDDGFDVPSYAFPQVSFVFVP